MGRSGIHGVLRALASGDISVDEAVAKVEGLRTQDIGFARIDRDRSRRRGFPEVVFCQGKARDEVAAILASQAETGESVLATRMDQEIYAEVSRGLPDLEYDARGRVAWIDRGTAKPGAGRVVVVTAGTADLPAAIEARVSLQVMGNDVEMLVDVGVAGLHRLLDARDVLESARVIVVVAGMEGALPSVVAGLVACPVIAVPTSVGYGISEGGFVALMGMLSSCAAGLSVVNIDNGFGAAYAASLINHLPATVEECNGD